MKLDAIKTTPTHMGGVETVKKFEMVVNAQSFKLLSSGLYSNQIKAIIRELSTNAWDSHIQAGITDRSFDVELPNIFSKQFRIRDYGVGMTRTQLEEVYMKFFESNKTDTNDTNGMLGLGAKAPLGYTDTMSITSYVDGVGEACTVFLDDSGIPSTAFHGAFKTDEPNGVDIIVPTKSGDDWNWKHEAKQVFKWFPIQPKILNVESFKADFTTYLEHFDNVSVVEYKKAGHYNIGIQHAVMGNIAYPIDWTQLNPKYNQLKNISMDISFNIGEISFMSSREALHYDEKTILAVEMVLDQFVTHSFAKIKKDITEAKTIFDLMKKHRSLFSSVFSEVKKENFDRILAAQYREFGFRYNNTKSLSGVDLFKLIKLAKDVPARKKYQVFNDNLKTISKKTINLQPNRYWESFGIILNDYPTGLSRKLTALKKIKEFPKNTVWLVFNVGKKNSDMVEAKKYIDYLFPDAPDVRIASEMGFPEVKNSYNQDVLDPLNFTVCSLCKIDNYYDYRYIWDRGLNGERMIENDHENYYYFSMKSYKATDGLKEIKKSLPNLAQYIESFFNGKIIGLKEKDVHRVENLSNWYNLYDYLVKLSEKKLLPKEEKILQYNIDTHIIINSFLESAKQYKMFDDILSDDLRSLYIDLTNTTVLSIVKKVDRTNLIRNLLGLDNIVYETSNKELDKKIKGVYDSLPMAKVIFEKYSSLEDAINIINAFIK